MWLTSLSTLARWKKQLGFLEQKPSPLEWLGNAFAIVRAGDYAGRFRRKGINDLMTSHAHYRQVHHLRGLQFDIGSYCHCDRPWEGVILGSKAKKWLEYKRILVRHQSLLGAGKDEFWRADRKLDLWLGKSKIKASSRLSQPFSSRPPSPLTVESSVNCERSRFGLLPKVPICFIKCGIYGAD